MRNEEESSLLWGRKICPCGQKINQISYNVRILSLLPLPGRDVGV